MKKVKKDPDWVRLQLRINKDVMIALRKRAAEELNSVRKIIEEWVRSWKEKEK